MLGFLRLKPSFHSTLLQNFQNGGSSNDDDDANINATKTDDSKQESEEEETVTPKEHLKTPTKSGSSTTARAKKEQEQAPKRPHFFDFVQALTEKARLKRNSENSFFMSFLESNNKESVTPSTKSTTSSADHMKKSGSIKLLTDEGNMRKLPPTPRSQSDEKESYINQLNQSVCHTKSKSDQSEHDKPKCGSLTIMTSSQHYKGVDSLKRGEWKLPLASSSPVNEFEFMREESGFLTDESDSNRTDESKSSTLESVEFRNEYDFTSAELRLTANDFQLSKKDEFEVLEMPISGNRSTTFDETSSVDRPEITADDSGFISSDYDVATTEYRLLENIFQGSENESQLACESEPLRNVPKLPAVKTELVLFGQDLAASVDSISPLIDETQVDERFNEFLDEMDDDDDDIQIEEESKNETKTVELSVKDLTNEPIVLSEELNATNDEKSEDKVKSKAPTKEIEGTSNESEELLMEIADVSVIQNDVSVSQNAPIKSESESPISTDDDNCWLKNKTNLGPTITQSEQTQINGCFENIKSDFPEFESETTDGFKYKESDFPPLMSTVQDTRLPKNGTKTVKTTLTLINKSTEHCQKNETNQKFDSTKNEFEFETVEDGFELIKINKSIMKNSPKLLPKEGSEFIANELKLTIQGSRITAIDFERRTKEKDQELILSQSDFELKESVDSISTASLNRPELIEQNSVDAENASALESEAEISESAITNEPEISEPDCTVKPEISERKNKDESENFDPENNEPELNQPDNIKPEIFDKELPKKEGSEKSKMVESELNEQDVSETEQSEVELSEIVLMTKPELTEQSSVEPDSIDQESSEPRRITVPKLTKKNSRKSEMVASEFYEQDVSETEVLEAGSRTKPELTQQSSVEPDSIEQDSSEPRIIKKIQELNKKSSKKSEMDKSKFYEQDVSDTELIGAVSITKPELTEQSSVEPDSIEQESSEPESNEEEENDEEEGEVSKPDFIEQDSFETDSDDSSDSYEPIDFGLRWVIKSAGQFFGNTPRQLPQLPTNEADDFDQSPLSDSLSTIPEICSSDEELFERFKEENILTDKTDSEDEDENDSKNAEALKNEVEVKAEHDDKSDSGTEEEMESLDARELESEEESENQNRPIISKEDSVEAESKDLKSEDLELSEDDMDTMDAEELENKVGKKAVNEELTIKENSVEVESKELKSEDLELSDEESAEIASTEEGSKELLTPEDLELSEEESTETESFEEELDELDYFQPELFDSFRPSFERASYDPDLIESEATELVTVELKTIESEAMETKWDEAFSFESETIETENVDPDSIEPETINAEAGMMEPETSEPDVTETGVSAPEVIVPDVTEPEVAAPEVIVPEVTEPEVAAPEVIVPDVTEPEVSAPKVIDPDVTEPEVAAPEVIVPEATEPEVTAPEVIVPDVTEPEVSAPKVIDPDVTEPEVAAPEVIVPDVTATRVTGPEANEPELTQPEVSDPETTVPEVVEPEVVVPDITQSEVNKSDDTKPKVTEPEVAEPETTELDVTEPKVSAPVVTETDGTEPEVASAEVTELEATETKMIMIKYVAPEVTEQDMSEPKVIVSDRTDPELIAPEAAASEVTETEVTEPEVIIPEVAASGVTETEVTEPEVTEPKVIVSDVGKPELIIPELATQVVTEPDVIEKEVIVPKVAAPEVTVPEVAASEVIELEVTEVEAILPDDNEQGVAEPDVTKPKVAKIQSNKPKMNKTEMNQSETIKPESISPTKYEPEIMEPESSKPESTEPEINEVQTIQLDSLETKPIEATLSEPKKEQSDNLREEENPANVAIGVTSKESETTVIDSTIQVFDFRKDGMESLATNQEYTSLLSYEPKLTLGEINTGTVKTFEEEEAMTDEEEMITNGGKVTAKEENAINGDKKVIKDEEKVKDGVSLEPYVNEIPSKKDVAAPIVEENGNEKELHSASDKKELQLDEGASQTTSDLESDETKVQSEKNNVETAVEISIDFKDKHDQNEIETEVKSPSENPSEALLHEINEDSTELKATVIGSNNEMGDSDKAENETKTFENATILNSDTDVKLDDVVNDVSDVYDVDVEKKLTSKDKKNEREGAYSFKSSIHQGEKTEAHFGEATDFEVTIISQKVPATESEITVELPIDGRVVPVILRNLTTNETKSTTFISDVMPDIKLTESRVEPLSNKSDDESRSSSEKSRFNGSKLVQKTFEKIPDGSKPTDGIFNTTVHENKLKNDKKHFTNKSDDLVQNVSKSTLLDSNSTLNTPKTFESNDLNKLATNETDTIKTKLSEMRTGIIEDRTFEISDVKRPISKSHSMVDISTRTFECPQCKRLFPNSSSLKIHLRAKVALRQRRGASIFAIR